MSLTGRTPRPLRRDAASLRDDRLFIVACDDQYAPKQYFDFFRITRVQVHVITTTDGTSVASEVLKRLVQVEHDDDDELWMLLDTDHCTRGSHLRSFVAALGRARKLGVKVALTKPCFELWLLLHHVEESEVVSHTNAAGVIDALRSELGQYNKTNLKPEHYPIASVSAACARAERLDKTTGSNSIPKGNTARVYLLWKAIAAKALPSELPLELRGLIP